MPRVLVADDSPELGAFAQAVLEEAGFEVVSVSSGIAAIAAVERNGIDAAVLDVLMPGLSGDAIAERLCLVDPTLPVLLMTGTYGDQFVAGARSPVLRKPFSEEQLVEAVRKLLPGDATERE